MTKKRELKVGRAEAADYLGITVSQLNKLATEGKILKGENIGGKDRTFLRFTVAELDAARKVLAELKRQQTAKPAVKKTKASVSHIDAKRLDAINEKLETIQVQLGEIQGRLDVLDDFLSKRAVGAD